MDMPLPSNLGAAWNRRGAGFMCLAMLGFAVEDALLKIAAGSMPVGQVLVTFGILSVIAFSS